MKQMTEIRPIMIEEQLEKIEDLIIQYASGNFEYVLEPKDEEGTLGTVVTGIQMLGEELRDKTVSKEYFKSIFNSVNYGLLIVDNKGKIIDHNSVTLHFLNKSRKSIINQSLFKLLPYNESGFLSKKKTKISDYNFETEIINADKKRRIISVSSNALKDEQSSPKNIIKLVDITERQQFHQQMMSAIIETQEKERDRIANDLHDSIGQHLVALKMFLNFIKKYDNQADKRHELVNEMRKIVEESIHEIRTISYDQMPETLKRYGLQYAIADLSKKFEKTNPVKFHLLHKFEKLRLKPDFEINLFRITQEFIQNTIKHAQAQNIRLAIVIENEHLLVNYSDDGKGFEVHNTKDHGKGLKNMQSRINVFSGKYSLNSSLENGTVLQIKYPIESLVIK